MKNLFSLVIFITINFCLGQNISSPSEFLGYELGSEFTRHHRVIDYFKEISETLPGQVVLKQYGSTYEGRPLYVAIISSSKNIGNLEQIRRAHMGNTGITENTGNDFPIVWLSYNVHGNEASSTEASMLTLYKLLTEKTDWLENVVVIIDPCINPDGRDRYVNWYNQTRNHPYSANRNSSEHREPWPGGRPNHYLFDLNRDWVWASQIETQARLKIYNDWMPHIHVDFHEQYINDPYYFAPAAEPFHENITDWQREFQTIIGKNHAKYFDQNGWLYFTRERFDLLYPSYGDTYPTFMGAIGMTYEQAGHGLAGLGINNDEGIELTLKDRLLHHTVTGLSTVEMAVSNAPKMLSEFKQFFSESVNNNLNYVLHGDSDKINSLKSLLDKHRIKYQTTSASKISGYNPRLKQNATLQLNEGDLVVSTNQSKGNMVKILFENRTKLVDSLTYDITAWPLPYAYGLDVITTTKSITPSNGTSQFQANKFESKVPGYAAKWTSIADAKFLADLIKNKIRVRFTNNPIENNSNQFDRGTLLILRADNNNEIFDNELAEIANKHQRNIVPLNSGFSSKGPDFGSSDIQLINPPKIAVLSGQYTSSLSFGEIWHYFEQQLNYPIATLNTDYFKQVSLDDFNILVIPNGYYGGYFDDATREKLKSFISKGGKVIAIEGALNIFADKEGFELKQHKSENKRDSLTTAKDLIPYNQRERESIKDLITGAVFNLNLDNTHPLAFGYPKNYYSLKLGNEAYNLLEKGYSVGYLGDNPVSISGFAGSNTLKNLSNSLVFGEESIGSGSVIYLADNVLFRSFWENGKLFFANALFLVNNGSYQEF